MSNDIEDARVLRTLGLLMRGALHEIANPLVALVGSAELALLDAEPGSKLYERIALTRRTGTEIAEIVRALQAFIRLQDEPAAELSVGGAAADAVALVTQVLPTRGHVLLVTGEATVFAAPGQLRGALVELLVEELVRAEPGTTIELRVADDAVTASSGGRMGLYDLRRSPDGS